MKFYFNTGEQGNKRKRALLGALLSVLVVRIHTKTVAFMAIEIITGLKSPLLPSGNSLALKIGNTRQKELSVFLLVRQTKGPTFCQPQQ